MKRCRRRLRRSVADWKRPSGDFDRHLSTIAWSPGGALSGSGSLCTIAPRTSATVSPSPIPFDGQLEWHIAVEDRDRYQNLPLPEHGSCRGAISGLYLAFLCRASARLTNIRKDSHGPPSLTFFHPLLPLPCLRCGGKEGFEQTAYSLDWKRQTCPDLKSCRALANQHVEAWDNCGSTAACRLQSRYRRQCRSP